MRPMKMVVQNMKTGALRVTDVAAPALQPEGVLVRTSTSLVSAGTDRAVIELAKKGYLGKARDRPDLVRKVLSRAKSDGLWATYKVVSNLVEEPVPLGYSLVGEVVEVGRHLHDVAVGDRVACAGLGLANHAEIVSIPKNLFVRVPDAVRDDQAAYVTLGAIALHGVRQADQQVGSTVLVVGLGLVGLITLQLCLASGHRVIGMDFDQRKNDLARSLGAHVTLRPDETGFDNAVAAATNGRGVDAVLLTAASRDSGEVFEQVARVARDRATVVVVGDVKMDVVRRSYFEKELVIKQSRSYGPGRYDQSYEEQGHDYPVGYVRWTERRNMEAFLDLVADGRVDPSVLTTHTFPIERAEEAYGLLTNPPAELMIGIRLEYPFDGDAPVRAVGERTRTSRPKGQIGLGVIGSGQFARAVLLPAIRSTKEFRVEAVSSARGLSADAVATKYGARYATADADRLLDDDAVHAVVIATRHDSHARYVVAALERGKHVFVEKPLCIDRDQLAEIERVAADSTGTLTVGFNRRFSAPLTVVRDHFRGVEEPLAMTYRVNAGRIRLGDPEAWVHDPKSGGGRIVGEGCHFVDVFSATCGASPIEVSAFASPPRRTDLPGDDVVTVVIRYADGSHASLHYFANGDRALAKERFEVFGGERVAVLSNYRRVDLVAGGRTKTKRWMSASKGFNEEAAGFLRACRTGEPAIGMESLLETTEVTLLAAEAIRRAGDGTRHG